VPQSPYKQALDVQDASNLSGVAHTFTTEILPALWQEARDHGQATDYVARHPVTLLFLDKMASLAGTYLAADLTLAYQQCREEVAAIANEALDYCRCGHQRKAHSAERCLAYIGASCNCRAFTLTQSNMGTPRAHNTYAERRAILED
jgi:hypothetical protein